MQIDAILSNYKFFCLQGFLAFVIACNFTSFREIVSFSVCNINVFQQTAAAYPMMMQSTGGQPATAAMYALSQHTAAGYPQTAYSSPVS